MNIVMLGHENAGKTTYMALMYEAMSSGVHSFSVNAENEAVHKRLMSSARKIHTSRYPPASSRRSIYELTLRHGGSSVMDFTWKDYRGGALTERANSAQTTELLEDLRTTDGIVIFIDAVDLLTNSRALRKVRSLLVLLHKALDERDRTTPLVLAITKIDLLPNDVDQSTLLAPFQQLIEAVSKTQHIFGTVIPISCGPQPVNVVYPVLFCLHFGLRSNAEYLMSIINAHVAVADEAKRRATPWNRVSNWATGAPAWARISRGHYSEASYQFQRLEPLLAPSEQLGSLLQQEELLLF